MSYKEAIAESDLPMAGTVVIDFWAPWCGPCKMYGPVFEQVADELSSDSIAFVKVNTDGDGVELARKYGVRGIPYTLIMQDGQPIRNASGVMTADALKSLVASN